MAAVARKVLAPSLDLLDIKFDIITPNIRGVQILRHESLKVKLQALHLPLIHRKQGRDV